MTFATFAMAERCVSNSLLQLIMIDQWLDQACDDKPDSLRLLRSGLDEMVPHLTNCAFGTTLLEPRSVGDRNP